MLDFNFKSFSFLLCLVKTTKSDKNHIDKQLLNLIRNSSLRAFSGNIANAVHNLDEYGCWCYFYDNVGRGKGTPVDEIDGFCKTLHEGYKCAMIDGEEEGETCIPWESDYNPGSGAGVNIFRTCQELNPGSNCAQRSCAVEGQFVDNLFAFLLSGSLIDYESYSHDNGFDPSTDAAQWQKTCFYADIGISERSKIEIQGFYYFLIF